MAECNHVFIGRSDGVHCVKCGSHMSAAEYIKYLNPEPEGKPKRQTRKKVKTND